MTDQNRPWRRQGEGFWRAHHEAWKRSDLNQRQYCEFHNLPQKVCENWRQKFKAEPEPLQRKLLYRRRPLSPPLSPPVSPPLSPGDLSLLAVRTPIVPRPREGQRRRFSEADKASILAEAARPGASAANVARRYGIDRRVLRRHHPTALISALSSVGAANILTGDPASGSERGDTAVSIPLVQRIRDHKTGQLHSDTFLDNSIGLH
jgi:hypothetical protein